MSPIDGKTALYGIMGLPVAHSRSPAMHNRAFQELGINSVYLPFPVTDVPAALNGFRALGIRGVSVTIPHKQAVLPFLDSVDPVAARIGAVNTLVVENGRIHGLNTDWLGANRALAEKMTLPGSSVLLLGAGGSARAIGFGLVEAGARVTLASRTSEKGRALARQLGCEWYPLADGLSGLRADALVNATSVGMTPHDKESPVPPEVLPCFPVVMDIVYAPRVTRLLAEASEAGCSVVDGLAMLLYQGVEQFEVWTGRAAPVAAMREVFLAGLAREAR